MRGWPSWRRLCHIFALLWVVAQHVDNLDGRRGLQGRVNPLTSFREIRR
jgi:hypothetical protein